MSAEPKAPVAATPVKPTEEVLETDFSADFRAKQYVQMKELAMKLATEAGHAQKIAERLAKGWKSDVRKQVDKARADEREYAKRVYKVTGSLRLIARLNGEDILSAADQYDLGIRTMRNGEER